MIRILRIVGLAYRTGREVCEMSGWRCVIKTLHELGGGPIPSAKFLAHHQPNDLYVMQGMGLVKKSRADLRIGKDPLWSLTQLGWNHCEGRVAWASPFVSPRGKGRAKGTKNRFIATWLMSLPQTNEIRL